MNGKEAVPDCTNRPYSGSENRPHPVHGTVPFRFTQRNQVEAATITGIEAIVETKMASRASRVRTW